MVSSKTPKVGTKQAEKSTIPDVFRKPGSKKRELKNITGGPNAFGTENQ